MNCCDSFGVCRQGPSCPVRATPHDKTGGDSRLTETPHDKAVRNFWLTEPLKLHIEAYTGPSRLNRVLDAVGDWWDRAVDLCRAARYWVNSALRDALEVLPSVLWALCAVLACMLVAAVVVGYVR